MRHGTLSRVTGTAVLALLSVPFTILAQEQAQGHAKKHTKYTLVDIGTLGGPNSGLNGGSVTANRNGVVVGQADTPDFDPDCGCNVTHAFRWRQGVLTDLGTLPGDNNSLAVAINSDGAVVGFSYVIDPVTGLPEFVGTLWNHGSTAALGTLGGPLSIPLAINDRGQAAGGATNTVPDPDGFAALLLFQIAIPGNQWHATLWKDGTIHDLGTLADGLTSFSIAVNERSQVAGFSFTDTTPNVATGLPTLHGFIWDDSHLVDLGTLGGAFVMPTGLNSHGQIAGFSSLAGEQTNHAFFWDQGSLKDLGTLGGTYSQADALNEKGEVVGLSSTAGDQIFDGYLWRNGVMTDLGSIGGCGSNAVSINSKSQVVGESFQCEGDTTHHPYLWENGGPMIDLNTFVPPGSDLQLHEPFYISDAGVITGTADLPNGDSHVFVLIPRGGDGDDDEEVNVAPAREIAHAPSAAGAAGPRLSPEIKSALRNRLANRQPRFGLRLPKQTQ